MILSINEKYKFRQIFKRIGLIYASLFNILLIFSIVNGAEPS